MKKTLMVLAAFAACTAMTFADDAAAAPKVTWGGSLSTGLYYVGGFDQAPNNLGFGDYSQTQVANRARINIGEDFSNSGFNILLGTNGPAATMGQVWAYAYAKTTDNQFQVNVGNLGFYDMTTGGGQSGVLDFDTDYGAALTFKPAAVKGLELAYMARLGSTYAWGNANGLDSSFWQNGSIYAAKYTNDAFSVVAGFQGTGRWGDYAPTAGNGSNMVVGGLTITAIKDLTINGEGIFYTQKGSADLIDEKVSYNVNPATTVSVGANQWLKNSSGLAADLVWGVQPGVTYKIADGLSFIGTVSLANGDSIGTNNKFEWAATPAISWTNGGSLVQVGAIFGTDYAQADVPNGLGPTYIHEEYSSSVGYMVHADYDIWF